MVHYDTASGRDDIYLGIIYFKPVAVVYRSS